MALPVLALGSVTTTMNEENQKANMQNPEKCYLVLSVQQIRRLLRNAVCAAKNQGISDRARLSNYRIVINSVLRDTTEGKEVGNVAFSNWPNK
jgi:hypothetical protein